MPDETIDILLRATTDAQKVVTDFQNVAKSIDEARTRVAALREDLINFSLKAQASLQETAKAMKEAFASKRLDPMTHPELTTGSKKDIANAMKEARSDIRSYNADVNAALKQEQDMRKETAKVAKEQEQLKTKAALEELEKQKQAEIGLQKTLTDLEKKKTEEAEKSAKKSGAAWKKEAQEVLAEQKRLASEAAAKTFTPTLLATGAVEGAQQFRSRLDEIKTAITGVSQQANISFKDAGRLLVEQAKKAGYAGDQLKKFKADVASATAEMNKGKFSIQNLASALGKLGIVVSIAQMFRTLSNFIKEATQSALEFTKAVYGMQIGVRALQRAGTDITIADVTANIKKLREEWGIFSEKELVEGTAQLLNLVRSFGFAKEQIFELQDAIATLAIVNGRAMDDVQRTVALAISSGYTEGLQRLGVSINRVTIAERAAQLGWKGGYTALTEQQRAYATYLTILEKTALYSDDAKQAQDELFGSIQKSKAIWADLKKEIGNSFLPIYAAVIKAIVSGAKQAWNGFKQMAVDIGTSVVILNAHLIFLANIAKQVWDVLSGKAAVVDVLGALKATVEAVKNARKEMMKAAFEEELPNLGDVPVVPPDLTQFTDTQLDAYEDLYRNLIELQEDYADKAKNIQESFQEDMLQIDADYAEKRADIWKDYYDEIAQINADATEAIADEEKDYAKSVADVNRDTQSSIADANRKYREDELKAEKDYQEKLRRLREEFLFDLEDALRERDALQVLRLIRRYNLDKAQLAREKDNEKQERADKYRQEMEDIRRQAQEKLAELQREHQERLAEIQAQKEKELEEARKQREEELAQAREDWEEAREERIKQHAQDLEDMKEWLEEQLTEITSNFTDMEGVTADMSNSVAAVIKKIFGTGGAADKSFREFNTMIDRAVANAAAAKAKMEQFLRDINSMSASILNTTNQTTSGGNLGVAGAGGGNYIPPTTTYHAKGLAPTLVTRPHMFMAGEGAVPEIVSITPVNKLGGNGNSNGMGGKATIEVWLSPDLEGKIMDNTLEATATILQSEFGKRR